MLARWVIHVVGPVFAHDEDRSHLLVSCYREALRIADSLHVRSMAFPAVSGGAYGWPIASAADIAVSTVRATETSVEHVRFVMVTDHAHDEFARALSSR